MNSKSTLALAAIVGALAVALGAFGAHALKPMLVAAGKLETYQTAVAYQFYHVFALLATGILQRTNSINTLSNAAVCFGIGILLFSGSLYLICFISIPYLGMVTTFGGILFIVGWIMLLVGVLKKQA